MTTSHKDEVARMTSQDGKLRDEDEIILAMCRAHDREESAQIGEPSPWREDFDRDPDWEQSRFLAMREAYDEVVAAWNRRTPSPEGGEAVAWRHVANEWADMATSGIQWLRNIRDGISTVDDALSNMDECLKHCEATREAASPSLDGPVTSGNSSSRDHAPISGSSVLEAANPEYEARARALRDSLRSEYPEDYERVGTVGELRATVAMLRQWTADACPAYENGRVSFARAMLEAAEETLSSYLAALPVARSDGPVTEAMLNAARDWSQAKYGKPIGNDAARGCWEAMSGALSSAEQVAGESSRDAILPSLDGEVRSQEGMVLVPREPTEGMLQAGKIASWATGYASDIWKAMLSAVPGGGEDEK